MSRCECTGGESEGVGMWCWGKGGNCFSLENISSISQSFYFDAHSKCRIVYFPIEIAGSSQCPHFPHVPR